MTLPVISPTEKRILTLSMYGFNSTEVARQLSLSPFTVRNHLSACARKLHTRSKLHTVMMALALGYLQPPLLPQMTAVAKPAEGGHRAAKA